MTTELKTDITANDTQAVAHATMRTAVMAPLPRSVPPCPGDIVGAYRLQSPLGRGVSSYVLRGWDEAKSCPVAVKLVDWGNVQNREAALAQMRTEAAALARVKHPRVVRFIDFGFDERWPYLVTEFVDGQSLGALIRVGGALPLDWALHLIGEAVNGLDACWRAGIVHRDLKPDNILVGSNGVAKLIDFGVAKSGLLPDANELAGTPAYVAPEQARNARAADLRSDIYSLGVTLYETLTGRLPFEATGRMAMIYQHLHAAPPPATHFNPQLPPLASDLCLWMLSKNPAERPQSAQDLREGLRTVRESMPVGS